jgi:hypothetical protein
MAFASDFMLNMDLGFNKAIRCHHDLDFAISHQGDILLTETDAEYILQKIFIWMSIKPGEVPGDPGLGCCIYKYFYKKAIPDTFARMGKEIRYQFEKWMPELRVTAVRAEGRTESGRVDGVQISIRTARHGEILIDTSQRELEDQNLIGQLTGPWADFRYRDNSGLADQVI